MSRSWRFAERGLAVVLMTALIQCGPVNSTAQVPAADIQITEALHAAPTEHKDGATVYGFGADGKLTTLRNGTGDLICISDDPNKEKWSVACYHKSLEPFMKMGRDLREQGITDGGEILKERFGAADAGTLQMPEKPAMLYVLTGDSYDSVNDEIENRYLRYVLYSPWATAESTGLPTRPEEPGQPWLMYAGMAGAHVMISPPKPE